MTVRILVGDALEQLRTLPDQSVRCCVTSPPYFGLRDYGIAGQMGLERTPDEYVAGMVAVFAEVRRVLADDGTLWLNLGDSYCAAPKGSDNGWDKSGLTKPTDGRERSAQIAQRASLRIKDAATKQASNASADGVRRNRAFPGLKPKDLIGIPWRVAFALQEDGWYLRQEIVWHKLNPMPESVRDRPTRSHEQIFLLAKSARYFYDAEAIEEPCSQSTHARVSQDVAAQLGSERANGGEKTNGNMKAVVRGSGNKERTTGESRGRPGSHLGASVPWTPTPKEKQHADGREGVKSNQSFARATALPVAYRNKRSVWSLATEAFSEAHFATFPPALIEPCILAGSAIGDTILDPFGGAGTTGLVADRLNRHAILIELNPTYAQMAERRIHADSPLFADVSRSSSEAP